MKYTKESLLALKTPYEEFQHKTVLEENKDLLEALSIEEKYQLANLLVSGCAYKDIEQYKSLGLKVYNGDYFNNTSFFVILSFYCDMKLLFFKILEPDNLKPHEEFLVIQANYDDPHGYLSNEARELLKQQPDGITYFVTTYKGIANTILDGVEEKICQRLILHTPKEQHQALLDRFNQLLNGSVFTTKLSEAINNANNASNTQSMQMESSHVFFKPFTNEVNTANATQSENQKIFLN